MPDRAKVGKRGAWRLTTASSNGVYWIFFALIVAMTVWMFYQQSRQQKARQKMQAELKRGDRVFTNGGLIGTVREVKEDRVVLEVAKEVRIEVLKSAVGGKYQE